MQKLGSGRVHQRERDKVVLTRRRWVEPERQTSRHTDKTPWVVELLVVYASLSVRTLEAPTPSTTFGLSSSSLSPSLYLSIEVSPSLSTREQRVPGIPRTAKRRPCSIMTSTQHFMWVVVVVYIDYGVVVVYMQPEMEFAVWPKCCTLS